MLEANRGPTRETSLSLWCRYVFFPHLKDVLRRPPRRPLGMISRALLSAIPLEFFLRPLSPQSHGRRTLSISVLKSPAPLLPHPLTGQPLRQLSFPIPPPVDPYMKMFGRSDVRSSLFLSFSRDCSVLIPSPRQLPIRRISPLPSPDMEELFIWLAILIDYVGRNFCYSVLATRAVNSYTCPKTFFHASTASPR